MRYSLVNRVKGAFLGALLGEKLATGNCGNLSKTAVARTRSLIKLGKLDIENWLLEENKINIELEHQLSQQLNNQNKEHYSNGQRVIAIVPLAIFYHENLRKLRENIIELGNKGSWNGIVRDGSLVIGYTIAQCLNEKIVPETLITEIIDFLGETSTLIPEKLMIVDHLLSEKTGLEIVQSKVKSPEILTNNISLAIYSFLSSLEHFELTVLRTSQNNYFPYPEITGAIAGALSGAYNSKSSIPVAWQIALTSEKLTHKGLNHQHQMLKLADSIIAVWSGYYDLNDHSENDIDKLTEIEHQIEYKTQYNIVAAPGIISSH